MADRKVGITIEASGNAAKAIAGMGTAAKGAAKAIGVMGKVGARAFSALGSATTTFNQALELGKKGMETFKLVVGESLTKALEFRKAGDPMVTFMTDLQRQTDLTRAALGDALLPVLKGLTEAFGSNVGNIGDMIRANRKLIATKVTSFLGDTAKLLVSGIAKGLTLANTAWRGMEAAVLTVKSTINEFFGDVLGGIAAGLDGFARLTRAMGDEAGAREIEAILNPIRALGDEFDRSAEKAGDAAVETIGAMDAFNQEVDAIAGKTVALVDKAVTNTGRLIKASTTGMKTTREEWDKQQAAMVESSTSAIDAILARRLAAIDAETAAFDAQAKLQDDQMEQRRERALSVSTFIADSFGEATLASISANEGLADSVKTLANVIRDNLIKAAIGAITAHAAEAAAAAFAAHAGIPFTGLAIGAAAAGVALLQVQAFAGGIKKFNQGGLVTGGIPGRDSVPALLTPGEVVVPAPAVKAARGGGGNTINFHATIQTLEISSETEQRRSLMRMAQQFEEMVKDGLILRDLMPVR